MLTLQPSRYYLEPVASKTLHSVLELGLGRQILLRHRLCLSSSLHELDINLHVLHGTRLASTAQPALRPPYSIGRKARDATVDEPKSLAIIVQVHVDAGLRM